MKRYRLAIILICLTSVTGLYIRAEMKRAEKKRAEEARFEKIMDLVSLEYSWPYRAVAKKLTRVTNTKKTCLTAQQFDRFLTKMIKRELKMMNEDPTYKATSEHILTTQRFIVSNGYQALLDASHLPSQSHCLDDPNNAVSVAIANQGIEASIDENA